MKFHARRISEFTAGIFICPLLAVLLILSENIAKSEVMTPELAARIEQVGAILSIALPYVMVVSNSLLLLAGKNAIGFGVLAGVPVTGYFISL